jgi:hypothetical protein
MQNNREHQKDEGLAGTLVKKTHVLYYRLSIICFAISDN